MKTATSDRRLSTRETSDTYGVRVKLLQPFCPILSRQNGSILRFGFLLLALLLSLNTSLLKAQTNPKIVEIEGRLQTLRKIYDDAAKKDAKNTGAIRLRTKIDNVLGGLGGYQAKQIGSQEFLLTLEDGMTEASRYPTDNARNTLKAFQDLVAVVKADGASGVPPKPKPANDPAESDATDSDAADSESVGSDNVNPEDLPQAKVAIGTDKQDQQKDVEKVIYLLFGVYLVAIIVMGLILSNAHKKSVKLLMERVVKLEKKVENLDLHSGPTGPTDATFVQKELSKRLESLENNTVGFLEQMEFRLRTLEEQGPISAGASTDNAQPIAKTEEFQQVLQRLRFLETQVGTGLVTTPQQKTGNVAKSLAQEPVNKMVVDAKAASRKGDSGVSEVVEVIANAVEHLSSRTQIPKLQHHAGQLLPNLMVAAKQGSMDGLETKILGETIQLAYASALNEGFREQYRDMAEAARKMDFIIEDRMSGRMKFSDQMAENIPFDEYLTMAKVRNADYPNFLEAKRKIETSELYKTAVNNMVLYTLKPSVIQHKDGVKNVVCKGIYVIKT